MTRKHSSTQRGEDEIEAVAEALELDDSVTQIAHAIINRARSEDILGGRAIETSADAAVILACKQDGLPYSVSDVVSASPVTTDETAVNRTQRKFQRKLGIEAAPPTPDKYIPRYAEELGVSDDTAQAALDVLEATLKADSSITSGKSPTNVAGAVLYLASRLRGEGRTQSQIKSLANVSGVTIRAIYKEVILTIDEHGLEFDLIDSDTLAEEIEKIKTRDTEKYVGSKEESVEA